jgi:energy-coupling factor transport system substrate-specific component
VAGGDSALSFVPGAGPAENLRHFWAFHLATSLGFDIPRAVFTGGFVLVAGRPILGALRRAARRAAFGAPVAFTEASADRVVDHPGDPGVEAPTVPPVS